MLMEGDPDVKVVLALREGGTYIPVKMYPRDKDAYEDVLKASINDSFTWYTKENQSFHIFMLDIDETHGELLGYREIPMSGVSGRLDIGYGCWVRMSVSVEAIK